MHLFIRLKLRSTIVLRISCPQAKQMNRSASVTLHPGLKGTLIINEEKIAAFQRLVQMIDNDTFQLFPVEIREVFFNVI